MKLLEHMKIATQHLLTAIRIAPLIIGLVILAEGVQHFVEWQLGMFNSQEAFKAQATNQTRLSFGIAKAFAIGIASYYIPKALTKKLGPSAVQDNFAKFYFKKMWDLREGIFGLIGMLLLATPLIAIHYALHYLAFGNIFAPLLLIIDSVLVGLIATVMGVSVWAQDMINYGSDATA